MINEKIIRDQNGHFFPVSFMLISHETASEFDVFYEGLTFS